MVSHRQCIEHRTQGREENCGQGGTGRRRGIRKQNVVPSAPPAPLRSCRNSMSSDTPRRKIKAGSRLTTWSSDISCRSGANSRRTTLPAPMCARPSPRSMLRCWRNQVLAAASAIFSWAVKQEIVLNNPCRGVDKNKSRERILSSVQD
jgi:hypothetical protein